MDWTELNVASKDTSQDTELGALRVLELAAHRALKNGFSDSLKCYSPLNIF
jgi:hypothetical protein